MTISKLRLQHDSDNIIPKNDVSSSRYGDNEELRYAMRSVEKYAPWVLYIFFWLQNGQIPSWIDMESPRLKIITHSDIYPNISHLPTFSSPSIESHLHNIPGLADNFLYFNDDVMLNQPVRSEDFYDKIQGTKIRLAWATPLCHSSCPNAWISDGYCERICNTVECDFDGGDCKSQHERNGGPHSSWMLDEIPVSKTVCATGCMKSWMADKFCDPLCNVENCGFDLGDCGTDQYDILHQIELSEISDQKIMMPDRHTNLYLNYTKVGVDEIMAAELNTTDTADIWAAVQSQFHVIPIAVDPNCTTEISFHLHLEFRKNNKTESAELFFHLPPKSERKVASTTEPTTIITKIVEPKISGNREPSQDVKMADISKTDLSELIRTLNESNPVGLKYIMDEKDQGLLTELGFSKKIVEMLSDVQRVPSRKLQSFQWEKESDFKELGQKLANRNHYKFKSRRLLDTFGDSLKYVNHLYNTFFG